MVNTYLFLAYAVVWLLFMVYAWSLSRRQTRLHEEMEELKSRAGARDSSRT